MWALISLDSQIPPYLTRRLMQHAMLFLLKLRKPRRIPTDLIISQWVSIGIVGVHYTIDLARRHFCFSVPNTELKNKIDVTGVNSPIIVVKIVVVMTVQVYFSGQCFSVLCQLE